MSDGKITKLDNGPLQVQGGVPLLDPDGNVYEVKDPYFLCRCGHSTNRPFCTGAHKAAEFHDASRAK